MHFSKTKWANSQFIYAWFIEEKVIHNERVSGKLLIILNGLWAIIIIQGQLRVVYILDFVNIFIRYITNAKRWYPNFFFLHQNHHKGCKRDYLEAPDHLTSKRTGKTVREGLQPRVSIPLVRRGLLTSCS